MDLLCVNIFSPGDYLLVIQAVKRSVFYTHPSTADLCPSNFKLLKCQHTCNHVGAPASTAKMPTAADQSYCLSVLTHNTEAKWELPEHHCCKGTHQLPWLRYITFTADMIHPGYVQHGGKRMIHMPSGPTWGTLTLRSCTLTEFSI